MQGIFFVCFLIVCRLSVKKPPLGIVREKKHNSLLFGRVHTINLAICSNPTGICAS